MDGILWICGFLCVIPLVMIMIMENGKIKPEQLGKVQHFMLTVSGVCLVIVFVVCVRFLINRI